jgi:hypothetical protein
LRVRGRGDDEADVGSAAGVTGGKQKLVPFGLGVHLEFGRVECLVRRRLALEFRGEVPFRIMRNGA